MISIRTHHINIGFLCFFFLQSGNWGQNSMGRALGAFFIHFMLLIFSICFTKLIYIWPFEIDWCVIFSKWKRNQIESKNVQKPLRADKHHWNSSMNKSLKRNETKKVFERKFIFFFISIQSQVYRTDNNETNDEAKTKTPILEKFPIHVRNTNANCWIDKD